MNTELVNSLAKIINSLTEEEKASLESQINNSQRQESKPIDFENEPFVGMWRDRQDLTDSSQWVRQLRESEWTINND